HLRPPSGFLSRSPAGVSSRLGTPAFGACSRISNTNHPSREPGILVIQYVTNWLAGAFSPSFGGWVQRHHDLAELLSSFHECEGLRSSRQGKHVAHHRPHAVAAYEVDQA